MAFEDARHAVVSTVVVYPGVLPDVVPVVSIFSRDSYSDFRPTWPGAMPHVVAVVSAFVSGVTASTRRARRVYFVSFVPLGFRSAGHVFLVSCDPQGTRRGRRPSSGAPGARGILIVAIATNLSRRMRCSKRWRFSVRWA